MFSQVFHVIALLHHLFIMYYVFTQLDFSQSKHQYIVNMNNYFCRFFTGWNFAVQTMFLSLCVVEDVLIVKQTEVPKLLKKVKNFMYNAIVFPNGVFVALAFWTVYLYDRELVFPSAADTVVPSWVNHALHTSILFVVLLQLLLCPQRNVSRRLTLSILGNVGFMVTYDIVFLWTYVVSGTWLYPIYYALGTWTNQMATLTTGNVLVFALCWAGIRISSKLTEKAHLEGIRGRVAVTGAKKLV